MRWCQSAARPGGIVKTGCWRAGHPDGQKMNLVMRTLTRLGGGGARSEIRREYIRRSGSSISSWQRSRADVVIFWEGD